MRGAGMSRCFWETNVTVPWNERQPAPGGAVSLSLATQGHHRVPRNGGGGERALLSREPLPCEREGNPTQSQDIPPLTRALHVLFWVFNTVVYLYLSHSNLSQNEKLYICLLFMKIANSHEIAASTFLQSSGKGRPPYYGPCLSQSPHWSSHRTNTFLLTSPPESFLKSLAGTPAAHHHLLFIISSHLKPPQLLKFTSRVGRDNDSKQC